MLLSLCLGWNVDVCWHAAILRQLLLSCADWQHSITTSDSLWWHVADSSVGIYDTLKQQLHYIAVVMLCDKDDSASRS